MQTKPPHRHGDPALIRVDRTIPTTWLIGLLIIGAANAAVFYAKFSSLIDSNQALTVEVKLMGKQLSEKSVADATRDARLNEFERRISELAGAVKILESRDK